MTTTESEHLIDPLANELMHNSKGVVKDLIRGIGMFSFASRLVSIIGVFVIFYTAILAWAGYYQLGQFVGQVGAYGSIAAGASLYLVALLLRKQHNELKKRYSSLFVLAEKFGVG